MSTTVNKISISIPEYIYERVAQTKNVSAFITEAVEEKLLTETIENPVEDFIAMRSRLPKIRKEDIREAINKGRM